MNKDIFPNTTVTLIGLYMRQARESPFVKHLGPHDPIVLPDDKIM